MCHIYSNISGFNWIIVVNVAFCVLFGEENKLISLCSIHYGGQFLFLFFIFLLEFKSSAIHFETTENLLWGNEAATVRIKS